MTKRESRKVLRTLAGRVSLPEAAKRLGVTERTIRRWIKGGVSRRYRVKAEATYARHEAALERAEARRTKEVARKPTISGNVLDHIRERLATVSEVLAQDSSLGISPVGMQVQAERNADKTVDGQLTISLPHGVTVIELIGALEDAIRLAGSYRRGTWISGGLRWPQKHSDDDDRYDHYRGLNQLTFYWQRSGKFINHLEALKGSGKALQEWGWRKAAQMLVRVHWNRYDKKPEGRD